MDIASIIAPHTIDQIEKIYHGLDHNCRCGCGGKYFKAGERGFKMAMTKLSKIEPLAKGTEMFTHDGRIVKCEGIDKCNIYVNIPVDADHDKCYCLYFKREKAN